jgi:hypothetical protein
MYQIYSKKINTKLYGSGFFGNTLRQWSTIEELVKARPRPYMVVLRQAREGGGGICNYELTVERAVNFYRMHTARGETGLYFSEQIKGQPGNIVFQGEYLHGATDYLRCSKAKMFHRPAMDVAAHFTGAGCRLIIKDNMPLPYAMEILNLGYCFPEHVIEFTLCNESIGIKDTPLIIWECRKY